MAAAMASTNPAPAIAQCYDALQRTCLSSGTASSRKSKISVSLIAADTSERWQQQHTREASMICHND
jgi:hypothetical protein